MRRGEASLLQSRSFTRIRRFRITARAFEPALLVLSVNRALAGFSAGKIAYATNMGWGLRERKILGRSIGWFGGVGYLVVWMEIGF